MGQHRSGTEPELRAHAEGEREDSDRGEQQDPAHDHQHRVDHGPEETEQRRGALGRQPGGGHTEEQGEDRQRHDRAFGGGGDDVGGEQRAQPHGDGRNVGNLGRREAGAHRL